MRMNCVYGVRTSGVWSEDTGKVRSRLLMDG